MNWKFQDWSENVEGLLHHIALAKCSVEVDLGSETGTATLCFFLKPFTDGHKPEINQWGSAMGHSYRSHYLALYVALLQGNGPLSFYLKTETTTGEGEGRTGFFSGKI